MKQWRNRIKNCSVSLVVYNTVCELFKTLRPPAIHMECREMKIQGIEIRELNEVMIGFQEQYREGMISLLA